MGAKWLATADGAEHTAVKGVDYQAKTEHFAGTLARRSASKGMPVTMRIDGDTVTYKFEPAPPAEPETPAAE